MTKDDVIKIIDGIPYYNYDYIGFLYDNLQKADKEVIRLNKCLIYLEKRFHNREEYENAKLVRQLKEANVEWIDNGINYYSKSSDNK